MNSRNIYNMTMKLFGSEPEPVFESSSELERYWGRQWGCDNDVGQLRAVMVHRPGDEFNIIDPEKRIDSIGCYGDVDEGWYLQSDTIPDLADMQAQHDAMTQILRDEGVDVIPVQGVSHNRFKSCYTRDSAFAIKGGAIVTRLAPRMRRGEELAVTRTLAEQGSPILRTIQGDGIFEGGSFAWLNSKNAVVGRSIRVNDSGIAQVADVLKHQGVELHVIDLCGYDIHIDGAFLMIDVNLALVNAQRLPYSFLQMLKTLGISVVEINQQDSSWIINGLAIKPGHLLMPEGMSDTTRQTLDGYGVSIIETPYDKMHHNGGGIHCSTCPLVRDSVD